MRILIYKRMHTGGPRRLGRFGIKDCTGIVRYRAGIVCSAAAVR